MAATRETNAQGKKNDTENRKHYYVNIRTRSIWEFPDTDEEANLEIEATPQEVRRLKQLFSKAQKNDAELYGDLHVDLLYEEGEEDQQHYNQALEEIYQMIDRLAKK